MEKLFLNIFILAAVQGILLSIFLFTKKDNHTANVILGIAIFTLSLDLLQGQYYVTGMYKEYPHLMGITYSFPYLFGPIFYLYTKLVSSGEDTFHKRYLLHFIPFFFVILYSIPVWFSNTQAKLEFLDKMFLNEPPLGFAIIGSLMPIHGIIYTILTVRLTVKHNRKIKDSFSNIEKVNLDWLKILMLGLIIIWSFVVFSFITDQISKSPSFNFAVPLAISILIYSIGYLGLKQPEIFSKHKTAIVKEEATEPADSEKQLKYKKSGLKDDEADKIINSLMNLMQKEKLHLDSELTIQRLSELLDISQHNLSEAINTRLNQNFYDFVNRYRVEEVKEKLKNPEFSSLNFLGIAFESGFKSKTSFNTIFKKYTGQTPTQYKESLSSEKLLQH